MNCPYSALRVYPSEKSLQELGATQLGHTCSGDGRPVSNGDAKIARNVFAIPSLKAMPTRGGGCHDTPATMEPNCNHG